MTVDLNMQCRLCNRAILKWIWAIAFTIWFALLSMILSSCSSRKEGQSPPIRHEVDNGEAALTYPATLKGHFTFAADLSLPEVQGNRSWYCIWLMIAELKGTAQKPAMLQIGLIRWDQSNYRPQIFVGTEHSGKELTFDAIPGLVSEHHRFSIRMTESTVDLIMDDKTVYSTARLGLFADDDKVYLKIAAEVYAVGDAISGIVDSIHFDNGTIDQNPPVSRAAFADRGLSFICKGSGTWVASGTFDPELAFKQYIPPPCN